VIGPDTVLIIDPTHLEAVGNSLASAGLCILTAQDGDSGLEMARHNQPDLILLGTMMPGIDGLEICRRLKEDETTREIPVILMTADLEIEKKINAFKAGCVDYLIKPFVFEEVTARINIHLAQRRTQRQLAEQNVRLQQEISERRQAEEKLRQVRTELTQQTEQEHLQLVAAMQQVAEGILITDADWVIQYINPAFSRLSGYSRDELIHQYIGIIRSNRHDRTFYTRIRDTLRSGAVWSGREIQKRKNGQLYEVEVTSSPVRDDSGGIVNFISIYRDITVEVSLERQLRQVQKLESIGTLAGGIAHDFNNILTAIIGFTEMAVSAVSQNDPLRRNLNYVLKASHRATDLVKQILAFTRQDEQEREAVKVAPIVEEALKLLRASLPTTIEIRQDITAHSMVLADPTQIHQILMNLCTNAGQAMRASRGVLNVRLRQTQVGTDLFSPIFSDLQPGFYLELTVSDTGCGMSAATLERIFDPYFTTKEPGEGTGLGLAVVQSIVKNHGGTITAESEPGKGSSFHVFLPAIKEDVEPIYTAQIRPMLPGENERILFVDDEELLASLGKQVLEALGYSVVIQTNGLEALETFRLRPYAFDLVITDMTMPGLTGRELAGEVMAIRPEIPIILCTGYSESIDQKTAMEAGIRGFIMKPMLIRELSDLIRKVLKEKDEPGPVSR
jgi:two-component system, cell cycle sensor histidine kinase and response regulator CckA